MYQAFLENFDGDLVKNKEVYNEKFQKFTSIYNKTKRGSLHTVNFSYVLTNIR